ncbi:MAG: MurR/RpiR family transcriptional regulator [Nitratireductor sp.]|nr:MurR/RpiR family transcriptional regulator [Nitratireductor sp.]
MSKKPAGRTAAPATETAAKLPRRGDGDVLDNIRRILPDLSDAEARAARAVLNQPDAVAKASIQEVARLAEVSDPTILRLCRRLGLEGFKDFKHRLTEDLVLSRMYLDAPSLVEKSTISELMTVLFDSVTRALRDATASLDLAAVDKAAEAMSKASMVYCIGVGGTSGVVAEELENRLFRLGIGAQATQDPYRQRMTAAIARRTEVLVAISSTGVPASIVEATELARANEATTIAITQAGSPLAKTAEILLDIEIFSDEVYFMLPSRTRYAQLFAIDLLAGALAARLPNAASNLKSIRDTLKAHHGTIRSQPIGD